MAPTGVTQDRSSTPSTRTEHEPHWATPHVKQRRIPVEREGNWAIVYEEFDLLRHLNLPVEIDERIETMNVSKRCADV
jgi:hypothetical protein